MPLVDFERPAAPGAVIDLGSVSLLERDLSQPSDTEVAGQRDLRVRSRQGRAAKRTVDVVVALPLVVLLAPAFLLLGLWVRLTSPGPALFRQRRIGRDGEEFTLLKFRTMCIDAEDQLRRNPTLAAEYRRNGFKLAIDRDPRVTKVGRLLRRTSLDELPQLLNVLAGAMSLVGPRPVLEDELVALYGPHRGSYEAVKPGMTGLWQVSGRSHVTHTARAELDADYISTWSFWRDVSLLVRTVPAVLRGVGAH